MRFDNFFRHIGKMVPTSELDKDDYNALTHPTEEPFNSVPVYYNGLAKTIYHISTLQCVDYGACQQIPGEKLSFSEQKAREQRADRAKKSYGRTIGNDYVRIIYDDSTASIFCGETFEWKGWGIDMGNFAGIEIILQPLAGSCRTRLRINVVKEIGDFLSLADGRWRTYEDSVLPLVVRQLVIEVCMANHSEIRYAPKGSQTPCEWEWRDIFQPTKITQNMTELSAYCEGRHQEQLKQHKQEQLRKTVEDENRKEAEDSFPTDSRAVPIPIGASRTNSGLDNSMFPNKLLGTQGASVPNPTGVRGILSQFNFGARSTLANTSTSSVHSSHSAASSRASTVTRRSGPINFNRPGRAEDVAAKEKMEKIADLLAADEFGDDSFYQFYGC